MADDFARQLRARTKIDKLMRLATNNANPHEAATARAQAVKLAKMYDLPLEGPAPTRKVVHAPIKTDLGAAFGMFRAAIKKNHPVSYIDEEDENG